MRDEIPECAVLTARNWERAGRGTAAGLCKRSCPVVSLQVQNRYWEKERSLEAYWGERLNDEPERVLKGRQPSEQAEHQL